MTGIKDTEHVRHDELWGRVSVYGVAHDQVQVCMISRMVHRMAESMCAWCCRPHSLCSGRYNVMLTL